MNNVVKLKTCSVCGKKFYGMTNCKYCCEDCKKKSLRNLERVRKIAEREEILGRKKQLSELEEFNKEARAAGMSYGQYEAKRNDAAHKEEYEKHKEELRKKLGKQRGLRNGKTR